MPKVKVLTLFKDAFGSLQHGVLGKAICSGKIELEIVDIRDYSKDKHKKCDDYPYGGGAGMLMTPQPIFDCIQSIDPTHSAKRIFLSPIGTPFCDNIAKRYAKEEQLILLCGQYEGVDQRVVDLCIDESISIGDYILTGGELAAMVVMDVIFRYCDGVLGNSQSTKVESFGSGLLEYSQYTRPQIFKNIEVPSVLLSGDHSKIEQWRHNSALKNTQKYRPDLYNNYIANSKNK